MWKTWCERTVAALVVVVAMLVVVEAGERYQKPSQLTPCRHTDNDPDGDCLFGVAGTDYPTYPFVPDGLAFKCPPSLPGIFADVETSCQVYHMCLTNGDLHSFLCPNGTMFHQEYFVCDLWFNVDCHRAPDFYRLNENIYKDSEPKLSYD